MAWHHEELTLSLPTGALGLGIRKQDENGLYFVYSKSNPNSPLQIGDVIIKINGITLTTVEGGLDAVVNIFTGFADMTRNVVVRRAKVATEKNDVPMPESSRVLSNEESKLTRLPSNDKNAFLLSSYSPNESDLNELYKAGIIAAITHLKASPTGSCCIAIRKHMESTCLLNKNFMNEPFFHNLDKMVEDGDLVQVGASYKLIDHCKKGRGESKSAENDDVPTKESPPAPTKVNANPTLNVLGKVDKMIEELDAYIQEEEAEDARIPSSPSSIESEMDEGCKAGIIKAITELNDRNGSDMIDIRKHMQSTSTWWSNAKYPTSTFVSTLKAMAEQGELVLGKQSYKRCYKLSADFKKRQKGSTDAAVVPIQVSLPVPAKASSVMNNYDEDSFNDNASLSSVESELDDAEMKYKEGIIKAITELKVSKGCSLIAIKNEMKSIWPSDKTWLNELFLITLNKMVTKGDLIQVRYLYKLSSDCKKRHLKSDDMMIDAVSSNLPVKTAPMLNNDDENFFNDNASLSSVDSECDNAEMYKAAIIKAITEMNDRTGSSSIAIKKHVQSRWPLDKKWMSYMILVCLQKLVSDGDLVQVKHSYKLSADYKRRQMESKSIGCPPVPLTLPVEPALSMEDNMAEPSCRPYLSFNGEDIARMNEELSVHSWANIGSGGRYRAGIIQAISELKDRTGSSTIAIKKHMQSRMPQTKKWMNGVYLNTLKKMVTECDLVQIKNSYKLSAHYKRKQNESERIKKRKLKEMENIGKKKAKGMERDKQKGLKDFEIEQQQESIVMTNKFLKPARVSLSPQLARTSSVDAMEACAPTAPGVDAPQSKPASITSAQNARDLVHQGVLARHTKSILATTAINATSSVSNTSATEYPDGQRNHREKVTVSIDKLWREIPLGVGIQDQPNGTVKVMAMAPDSLFIGSGLRLGMDLVSINGTRCTTASEAAKMLKSGQGQMTIVALVPSSTPTAPVGGTLVSAI